MINAPIGPTNPEAGVIEANPAIVPVTKPIIVGLPDLIQSIAIQTNDAVAAEISSRVAEKQNLCRQAIAEKNNPSTFYYIPNMHSVGNMT